MSTAQSVIENAVIDMLVQTGPCTMDEVATSLPAHSWSEVFSAVDEMSRDDRLVLRRPSNSSSGYELSLSASCRGDRPVRTRPAPVRFCVGCGYLCDAIQAEDGETPWTDASQYLKKYGLAWNKLERRDDACPACARVLACAYSRLPAAKVSTLTT